MNICIERECEFPAEIRGYCRRDYFRKCYRGEITVRTPNAPLVLVDTTASAEAHERGVTPQRIEQLRHPDKHRARQNLRYAIKVGKVTRPDVCEKCQKGEGVMHGHHHDYSKPLEVEWLCGKCHGTAHALPQVYRKLGTAGRMKYSTEQVLAHLRTALIAYGSQRKAAKVLGLSETVLSDVLHGRKQITGRMLDVVGFERVRSTATTYRKISAPEPRENAK